MKRFGHFLDGEAGSLRRFGFGWSKSGIEQVSQPVFEDGGFLARFPARQFRAKLNRRFATDD